MSSITTAIELLPLGLRHHVSAEVGEALVRAGEAARTAGRAELTAGDLLDALTVVMGSAAPPARAPSPARVTPYRDGPYLLRGRFELTDQDGEPIPCARSTVALCRCGRSQIRPFCDGTHKLVGFRAESGAEADAPPEASYPPADSV
ncbi:CDGSH iron-sulfur domain-containing protein [Conexibacter woesei]|uniref:Iron sulphur domain-containing, CDGSH-type n=1 Tax=Conexibacter woesei (strain DSM 14684 / CCUG 47730 / CIP 108061 / JCM 11494 / NBRC 100937 / ID131577) TaxID=469383 RepID=D3F4C3_CONWI|nr:CDGSH iron-sulfur domain-containing protein [Conexibacter woesei]ADB50495.1 Iron sulphur domain-containing, CDGSH-type [Conexibacter woesei DSM 14684]